MISVVCTVFFEGPFYVGIFERTDERGYSAAKFTFGAEPKDSDVLELILHGYKRLEYSTPETAEKAVTVKRMNPKRLQREAEKAMSTVGTGTKAQQALKAQYEANKTQCKSNSRDEREAEAERIRLLRREKKKAKHRGH